MSSTPGESYQIGDTGPAGDTVAPRVLLLGDEPLNRGLVTRILELGGYSPVVSSALVAAIDAVADDVALVIRDLGHTETTDPELLRWLEEAGGSPGLIYLTGDATADRDDGAGHPVIAKPFTAEHLLEVVAEVLGGRGCERSSR